ncbi:hypothetical protein QJQ45_002476 [Haematococcus lacustris]|nr:hypothetical protein QJQ45_002476 [Haematococcus lacustris]
MELGSPRATQRLQMQTLLRRSSMATAEDVRQIPGVSGPLRKRSRTDQPNISTPVWYHRHFGANGEGCDSDRRKCNFCSFAVKAAPGSNPNHLGAHLLTANCSYLLSVEARADAANVHTVRQHLEARQGQAGPSLEVDNHGVDRLLLEWLLHDGLPLTIVESGAFLEFVRALKPDWTPPSRYLRQETTTPLRSPSTMHLRCAMSFYDRDVSAALNIRRCEVGPGPRPTELCYWTNRPAMPKPGQPGQDWVEIADKALLRKWRRKLQR